MTNEIGEKIRLLSIRIPWSPPLRLSSRQMRASVSWYMGSEALFGTTTCSKCPHPLDPFGDHAEVCALGEHVPH